jgi:hypothetical protein
VCRYIFFAFEDAGFDLPLINKHRMCRNGCCTTCALKVPPSCTTSYFLHAGLEMPPSRAICALQKELGCSNASVLDLIL